MIGIRVLGALAAAALAGACAAKPGVASEAPEQPIAFSHAQHAGDLRIDCRHCHTRVAVGAEANLPAVAKCEGCHAGVKEERTTAEMAKVSKHLEERRPIAWIKVHDLPDHVRFDHGAHVRAQVHCGECHGEVHTMAVVRQVREFTMPYCVDCHRREGASIDCTACHK